MKTTRISGALVAVTALLALTGCGGGTPVVKQSKLEDQIAKILTQKVGVAPDDISCPDDLKGKKGNVMHCTLTAGSDKLDVTVTVTGVDGKNVKFNAKVGEVGSGASS